MNKIENKDKWLVVVDLDGTTLNKDGETFNDINKKAFDALKEKGHVVCICTGRPWRSTQYIYNDLNFDTYVGTYNGGIMSHPLKPELKRVHKQIPREIVNKILNSPILKKNIINIIIEFEDTVYKLNDVGYLLKNISSLEHGKVSDLTKEENGDLKIYTDPFSVLIDVKGVGNVQTIFNDISKEFEDQVTLRPWSIEVDGSFVLELNPKDSDKSWFVKHAAEYYGIDMKNTMCFGDAENDQEMIEISKMGIAMKNATNSLQKIANDITEHTNEDGGVGNYLNKFFELKL